MKTVRPAIASIVRSRKSPQLIEQLAEMDTLDLVNTDMKNLSWEPDPKPTPDVPDVRSIRRSSEINMTQQQFADKFELGLTNVRNWEQSIRKPSHGSRKLLQLVEKFPRQMLNLVEELEE